MAKKVKRLTRKELLKEDELTLRLKFFTSWLFEYRVYLISIFGVIIAGLLIYGGIKWAVSAASHDADQAFSEAMHYYNGYVGTEEQAKSNPNLKHAMRFDDEESLWEGSARKFDSIIEQYGDSRSGKLALIYSANCYYNLKEYDKAAELYSKYVEKAGNDYEGTFVNLALESLGYSYEMAGNADQAISAFEKLAESKMKAYRERGLFNTARMYQAKNDNSQALKFYKILAEEYPDTKNAKHVQNVIAKLEAGS